MIDNPLNYLDLPYKTLYLKDRELKYLADVIFLAINDEKLCKEDPQGTKIGQRLHKYIVDKIRSSDE